MGNSNMQEVLQGALTLNGNDKKYTITVEENKIITTVKWMDAVLFAPTSVSDEMKEFRFVAKLNPDKTWVEIDESKSVQKSVGPRKVEVNFDGFKGKQIGFNKTIAFGKNRNNGETGIINIEFNTEEYKKPVAEYLANCGYRKTNKGFFSSLFG